MDLVDPILIHYRGTTESCSLSAMHLEELCDPGYICASRMLKEGQGVYDRVDAILQSSKTLNWSQQEAVLRSAGRRVSVSVDIVPS